ncbi:MAG: hypothetical protein V3U22_04285, partial [Vicinamibacteria bacterium]
RSVQFRAHLSSKRTYQIEDCMKSFEMVFVLLTASGRDTGRAIRWRGAKELLPSALIGRSSRT